METKSGSFPPGTTPLVCTSSHKWLLEHPEVLASKTLDFFYQPVNHHDIPELKLLQNELFPIQYSDSLYNEIGSQIISLGCYLNHPGYNLGEIPMLVGAILFRVQMNTSNSHLRWTYMMSSTRCTYIITIGVVTILRGRGIAKNLINYCLDYSRKSESTPLYISLHVAEYNSEAIPFYESFGFELAEKLENHYYINNEYFDAYHYIYYLLPSLEPILTWKNLQYSSSQVLSLCKCFKAFKFFKDS